MMHGKKGTGKMGTGKKGMEKRAQEKWAQEKMARKKGHRKNGHRKKGTNEKLGKKGTKEKIVFTCKLLLLLFNQHLSYSMCTLVVIAYRFHFVKFILYLIRTILIIKKLIMTTQSQIYLLAFSNIDQTTYQH